MASSSEIKHDVFLSFRGKDTRRNFTGHLHAALTRNCIDAFIDGGGEGISETLFNKISESLVSVVIFSLNYADSPWCLDELVKVVECRQKMGQTVLPVFLGVEPTHVRKQTGPFGVAFNRLVQNPQFKDREEIWKRALVETANLSGWDSEAKSQDKIVEEIVNRIEKILDQMSLRDQYDGFVGISRVEKIESLLCIGSTGRVCSIGIWGMGGIGKTTIARLLFYRLSHTFNGACFVGHVRARVEREGLGSVQKDMILQLLGVKSTSAGPYMLSPAICRKLRRKKLLIVLDDVDNPRQLKALVGREDFYGQGSRIIVTSRDKQVLKNGCSGLYEVQKLNQRESLQLFKLHAFRQDQPTTEFIELSKKAMLFAQGLPLAIEVLGCNLYGRDMKEWEIELSKLEEIPNLEVTDILRISYDGLDEKEKSIFLDIACIFQGSMKDHVESVLDGCGFFAGIGLSRLFDKALITVSKGTLWMHDLLQQMGQDIVLHECLEEPGKRSRLWRWKDIDDVLTKGMGTEKVEAMSLNLYRAKDMILMPVAFVRMCKLRVLNFHYRRMQGFQSMKKHLLNARRDGCFNYDMKIHLPQGLEFLPNELRYFHWDQYPLASLPLKFQPEYLVELDMYNSHIKELWSGSLEPHLPHLKYMNLTSCKDLIKLPDFSKIPNLEDLYLCYCESLVEVPSSIQHLINLQNFDLSGCSKLTKLSAFPQNVVNLSLSGTGVEELPGMGELKRLQRLIIFDCSNLTHIPESIGNLHSLKRLDVSRTAIRRLPDDFCNLKSLEFLRVDQCWNLNELPENLGNLKSLQHLDTSESPIKSLPSSIVHLSKLTDLLCSEFNGTQLLAFPLDLGSLNFIGTPESLCLVSLKELDLQASNLDSLPASIKQLPNLRLLLLNNCKKLTCLPELPSSLQWLGTANCTILESVHSLTRGDHSRGPGFVFDFYNCTNLDGNTRIRLMTDAWQRVEIFVASVQESANKGSHGGGSDEEDGDEYQVWDSDEEDPCDDRAFLVMPGSKVPEWFEYSTFGSSVTIKLFDGRLMDPCPFGFCLVVASNCCEQRSLWVQCKCTLVTESGEYYSRICGNSSVWDSRYHRSPMEENVILWYGSEQVQVQGPSPICFTEAEATFEFYASDYEIVECGVTPVGNICNRFKGLPLVQHGNPGDEDEQSRKRFKKNV